MNEDDRNGDMSQRTLAMEEYPTSASQSDNWEGRYRARDHNSRGACIVLFTMSKKYTHRVNNDQKDKFIEIENIDDEDLGRPKYWVSRATIQGSNIRG
ncbi:hypothetical protein L2E82_29356 [Cichorium intybus]|uniref:Uncharacterized protein n=1 Tax=Cichorium intybus TaxID=13427 RepID=A0ACB9CXF3_CICIN|nr:hypothetical protein L2E82_29356 [Cichorium intybus]